MGESIKRARKILIDRYGEKCFIEKLKLRQHSSEDNNKRYKRKRRKKESKKERKISEQITFHHIVQQSEKGPDTPENGALLNLPNHRWFHHQSPQMQRIMNDMFQDYKKNIDDGIENPAEVVINKYKQQIKKLEKGKAKKSHPNIKEGLDR